MRTFSYILCATKISALTQVNRSKINWNYINNTVDRSSRLLRRHPFESWLLTFFTLLNSLRCPRRTLSFLMQQYNLYWSFR